MADGFSMSILAKPTLAALDDIQRRVDRASMYAVREAGRVAKRAAKAEAPVFMGGGAVTVRAAKKARKAGLTLGGETLAKGQLVEGNQVVAGLLRDSISSSRRLQHVGESYSLKVGPRGPRVHLYAAKIEGQHPYMRAAYTVAAAAAREIHEKAWAKAMSH